MPNAAPLAARSDGLPRPAIAALAGIAALTLWRLAMAALDATELSTDEAQYWFWGTAPALGYFSKPPLIGWLIGAATAVAGDSVAAVRLPAPVIHGAAAVAVLALALRLVPAAAAAFAALSYVTLPAVTLGSALMTTDTPLLLCAAVALLLQHRLAAAPSAAAAVALGLAVGLGVLAKYAMAYAVAGMALAALVAPAWRIGARDAALAAAVASAVVAPHLWWLAAEAFVTVRHVADDALWQGPRIDAGSALGFWAAQAAVMGPVLWGAWHLGLATARRAGGGIAGLAAASAVPVAVVLAQALTSRVLANWAVVFVAAGVILAARALHGRRAWQAISLALGLAVAVALPVVKVAGTEWQRPDGRLLLSRYAGQADLAATVATAARAQGAARLVAADREVLAALTWELRGQGFDVRATPDAGPARHHWDLARPWAPAPGPALMVLRAGDAAPCAGRPVQTFTAGPGFVQGRMFVLTALDGAACPAGGAPP